jgi:hypothetical protein
MIARKPALEHEQGSARDGVERLDAAVDEHRQAAKPVMS